MTLLGAAFTIEIAGILVARDVLGQALTFRASGGAWKIKFPAEPGDFRPAWARPAQQDLDPREYNPIAVIDDGGSLVEVRLVEVWVNFEHDRLSAKTFDAARDGQEYQGLLFRYEAEALGFVSDVCARLRLAHGQHWIEPAGRYPRSVGALDLVDLDTQRRFPVHLFRAGSMRVIADPLTAGDLPNLEKTLRQGRIDPEELLLSEAVYLARESPAPDRATLLAAIAVELRTKRVLRRLAGPGRAALLDLLLESPRDWSMSAHGLFLKAVHEFAGTTADAEYRATAKRVQALFTARNSFAHKGTPVSVEDGVAHVETALAAFKCLDAVLSTPVTGD